MEEKKYEKAIRVLEKHNIDKCCEWLLDYTGRRILDVPGVNRDSSNEEKPANIHAWIKFSYNGNHYDLRYENLEHCLLPFGDVIVSGDFFLRANSQVVLHTSFFQDDDGYVDEVNSINLLCIKSAILGDRLEVIPEIVARAKKIEQDKEREEKEASAQKIDDNIDLGKYE